MTLVEVLIAVAITSVVMSLALSVVGAGVRLARQGEQTVNSNEAARSGMEMVLRDLRAAGVPGGIWVTDPGGTPFRINSIFTQPGSGTADTGIDDLWMVVPRPNAMQSNCTSVGSGAVVTVSAPGTLAVNCTAVQLPLLFAGADTLLVSNFASAALISGLAFPGGTITFAQSATPNFSTNPSKGGFQRGDLVFPVDIIRYHVRLNPMLANGSFPLGRPELIRTRGALAGNPTMAAPFTIPAGAAEQRFPDIEDLQVAFGTGVAPALTFASAHAVTYTPAAAPLSVRVSMVGISPRVILDDQNKIQEFGPAVVENHTPPSLAFDGYRRSIYRRRIELINMGAVNL